MTTSYDFTVGTASQKFNLTHAKLATDINAALANDVTFLALTELGQDDDLANARTTVTDAGFQLVGYKDSDTAVVAAPNVTLVPEGCGHLKAHDGHPDPDRRLAYMARNITYARGLIDDNPDLDITFGAFHSITRRGGAAYRLAARAAMASAVSAFTVANGAGRRLVIAAGDTNEQDTLGSTGEQAKILSEAGLATVWDDLREYPPTIAGSNGGPIDWVIRRKADLRLTFTGVDVIPQTHIDHELVLAHVRVQLTAPILPVPHACPITDCGLVHLPPP